MSQRKNPLSIIGEVEKKLFYLLQRKGSMTKQEIVETTKMKRTSLNRVMKELQENRLITTVGIAESTGGRKPNIFGVDTSYYFAIGVDISRTYTNIVVTDLMMNIKNRIRFEMNEFCTPTKTVEKIVQAIEKMKKQLAISDYEIIGIGLGTVGPLERKKGIILSAKKFQALGWQDVPIQSMLEEMTGYEVTVDNGANAAVVSEQYFGAGKGYANIAYFNCGVGIRTGVVSDNHLIRTALNVEDAFAHMVVDIDGKKCSCGNYGCVESYASIISIVESFESNLKKGRFSQVPMCDRASFESICAWAEKGDVLAKEVIENAAAIFGVALANYMNLFNPHIVILSGPLIVHSCLFYETSIKIAKEKHSLTQQTSIRFSKQGNIKDNAIAIGAVTMAI